MRLFERKKQQQMIDVGRHRLGPSRRIGVNRWRDVMDRWNAEVADATRHPKAELGAIDGHQGRRLQPSHVVRGLPYTAEQLRQFGQNIVKIDQR